jgi:hypothetical protein
MVWALDGGRDGRLYYFRARGAVKGPAGGKAGGVTGRMKKMMRALPTTGPVL